MKAFVYRQRLSVEVFNIHVYSPRGGARGYFLFDYLYRRGARSRTGTYDQTYTTLRGREAIRKMLKRGYAHDLVLQRYA